MTGVAFYISGHGFGHASRQIEIINAAGRLFHPRILIRSSVQRWLFDRTVDVPFTLIDEAVDTGVVQIDSLRLDAASTIARAGEFYRTLDARAEREAALLRRHAIDLVIADAPPLACAAAHLAGIPAIVVGNFTWDWIYAEYGEYLGSAPGLIPIIQRAYRGADAAWRLPMHGGFAAFDAAWRAEAPEADRRLIDVPFVARHAGHSCDDTRRTLDLPLGRQLALASFGGYGVDDVRLDVLDTRAEWEVVVTGKETPTALPGVRFVSEPALYSAGLRYEDLVAACDVVVTKPGYGIISECIANHTAMVYTGRGRFAEYPVLVHEMPHYLRCAFLDQDALRAGRWREALEAAVAAPTPPDSPRTDGAGVIADMMAAYIS